MKAEKTIAEYIRDYANKHHISFEDAKEHAICELVAFYYGKNTENK